MNLYAALFRSTDSNSVNRNGVDTCLADEAPRNKGNEIREHRQKRLPDSTFCLVLFLYHFCGIVPFTRRKRPRILPVGFLPLDRRGFFAPVVLDYYSGASFRSGGVFVSVLIPIGLTGL
jgi:hypothetical protein